MPLTRGAGTPIRRALLCIALAVVAAGWPAWAAQPAPEQIDRLFAPWDKPDSAGLALVIVHQGRVVHSRGFGLAQIEHGARITPATPFHVASVSKQFTAYAIHLLAAEGRLSLDDLVRRHLPELQVDAPITLRHLLHHTSGMRDQWELALMAGLRLDDALSENDLLGLVRQQRQLNFPPGEDHLYSNSGYLLLGQVVRRVTGQTLAAFTQERIFTPLGMTRTRFQENYGTLVPGRAYSYTRTADGWRHVALTYSNTGATSLFTTAEDMALWPAYLDDPKGGSPAAVDALLQPTRLLNGREVRYGGGLALGRYRGVPVVEHSGADAGFRAHFMRLPTRKLAIIVLGNAADLAAGDLARRVADLYLQGEPGVQAPRALPSEVDVAGPELATYGGEFEVAPGRLVSFVVEQGRLFALTGGRRIALVATGPGEFAGRTVPMSVSFTSAPGLEPAPAAVWKSDEFELPLRRVPREAPTAAQLQACVGEYYSEELRTLYRLDLQGAQLTVRTPRVVLPLRPVNASVFIAGYPLGVLVMQRNAAGACEGFRVTTSRVRGLAFARARVVTGPEALK